MVDTPWIEEFQSPDGDFVYSDRTYIILLIGVMVSFNPLTGISSILTLPTLRRRRWGLKSFNPLTGISSILTNGVVFFNALRLEQFQSPDGDFVYSDQYIGGYLHGHGRFVSIP